MWLAPTKGRFGYVKIVDFYDPRGEELHAKVIVVDRQKAVVGSAYFTRNGMVLNREIAVLINGCAAWNLASLIGRLSAGGTAI